MKSPSAFGLHDSLLHDYMADPIVALLLFSPVLCGLLPVADLPRLFGIPRFGIIGASEKWLSLATVEVH